MSVVTSSSLQGESGDLSFNADQMLSLRQENSVLQEEILRLEGAAAQHGAKGHDLSAQIEDVARREAYITMVLGTDFKKAGNAGSEVCNV